jgi:hypothetical protein
VWAHLHCNILETEMMVTMEYLLSDEGIGDMIAIIVPILATFIVGYLVVCS